MLKKLLHFLSLRKEKIVRLSFGLFLVLVTSSLLFIKIEPIATWISTLENLGYDIQVRQIHKPLMKNNPIVIVDIDDASLQAEGRWPWSRNKIARLVAEIYKNGATVVAFDVTFPDVEENIAEKVIKELPQTPQMSSELSRVKEQFDFDGQLAKSLELGESVLGIVFKDDGKSTGFLPTPLLQLTPEQMKIAISDKQTYLANLEILQNAAKTAGFINATPDADGVMRFTPVVYKHGAALYGSLGLSAVARYLLSDKIELVTAQYNSTAVLEGIKLDQQFIPTDATGRMLIPFRGPPYTFPYIAATDILNGRVPPNAFEGKLIFIGATATAIGDIKPAAISSIFPGIEVHANVASGIIDHYLPFKPSWGRGVTFLLIIIFGMLYALILPFLGLLAMCLLCLLLPAALILGNSWLWSSQGIVISIFLPIALILLLFVFNLVWGYLFESKRSKDLKSMFGQYVPPAYLDNMIKQGGEFSLEGESKELTVLFSDIRGFTNVSEKMTATQLKQFLNQYLTPITEVIFNHKGTIDKYVGDMVMAFWGAPLDDPKQVYNAVTTGIAMQATLAKLNDIFEKENKPRIKIGVGINTGLMNVGDMGSKFRRAYTVLGDTVNLASRLEGQTKFYHVEIIVGEETYKQTKEDFVYRRLDKLKVKGKETGVEIYSPLCTAQELTPELKTELDQHHQALEGYFTQQWDGSEKGFKSLSEAYPANKELYQMYLDRIAFLRDNPPGPDWDGAFVSHEK
ncbi:MAG: adenylate/guanylate cyclase domain-containing protein [Verrucomicrobia bacterium]|nr:adenylate/guanylate cyclase domain-containing protein [Verrucomicrobiota bacterium]